MLALYIDFLFVSTFVFLANFLFGKLFAYVSEVGVPYVIGIVVSGVSVALARAIGLSVGRPLLNYARTEVAFEPRRRLWPNLLLGTLLMLDGLKQIVRWSQLEATLPVFGMLDTTPVKIAATVRLGALSVCAGIMLFAFAPTAKRVAAASMAAATTSLIASWSVLPEGLERAAVARRAYQGLPVREGEVEFLQSAMPYGSIAGLLALLMLLYLCRVRDRDDTGQNDGSVADRRVFGRRASR